MQKCIWSGVVSSDVIEVSIPIRNMLGFGRKDKSFWVLPKYEHDFREFAKVNFNRGPRFVAYILSSVVLIHVIIMLVGFNVISEKMLLFSLGILIIFQGLVILMYPHTNLDQAQLMSLSTAKKVSIGVSLFVLIVGIALIVAPFVNL